MATPTLTPAPPRPVAGARPPRAAASRVTVMVVRSLAIGLNFVLQLVMARVMSLAAFGAANTALALLNIIVIVAALGYETAAIRFVALAREDLPRLRGLGRQFLGAIAIGSVGACALVAIAAAVELRAGNTAIGVGLAMLIAIIPGFALVRVGEGCLRGLGSLVRALVNSGVVIPVVSIAFVALESVALGGGRSVGVAAALGARAAATLLAVATVGWFLWPKLGRALSPCTEPDAAVATEMHKVAVVLGAVAVLTTTVSQIDTVAVAVFEGVAQAGVYSAASRIAQAMNVALVAVNFVLAPRIARLYAAREMGRLQDEIASAATWSLILMLAAGVVLIPAAGLVLAIFGSGFGAGADPLRVLMLGQIVNALCGPAAAILAMTGGERKAVRALAGAALLDAMLFAVLIPPFGLVGAACATAACTAAWNLAMVFYIRRDLGLWSLPEPIERILP